ncbi:endonuclease/exonuclease/phosphatase family protein [Salegentibacter flavus]|uniref:Metal-dependent hydrolase, endonuclease/exonuclease/phosphatase family n=2 Tax=Salegentibacter TaxID=143222 RepID=A0A1I5BWJ3_9FLAO|nr:endonuclease/exonuclease/phosphatase family protein [Salegentibacter flavus]SFN79156.1 Metal-dependent hydrolase, endonuclease/exonuclease/phosphatase family [Salegentibacter flavus]
MFARMLNLQNMLLLLSTFFLTSSTSAQPKISDTIRLLEEIKVMSYNIHHANPPSQPDSIDIDAIVRVIKDQDADLVALQEVDSGMERSGEGNQAALIAEKLNMYFYFSKALNYNGGEYGNAILSKFPIEEGSTYQLPNEPEANTEDRVMSTGKIRLPGGNEIIFGSTHLDYKENSPSRIRQIKRVLEILKEMDQPVILAGDFNDVPGSETIDLLASAFQLTCSNCPPTIPVIEPVKAIDFIAYNHPQQKFRTKAHKVIDEKYASDHRPVFALIELLK